jgi:two-component system, NarL family, sensor histidine kinase DegS
LDPDARGLIDQRDPIDHPRSAMATTPRRPSQSSDPAQTGAGSVAELVVRLEHDVDTLDAELTEIDMLIAQAQTEGDRHEAKRAALSDRITAARASLRAEPADLAEQNAQLVLLTKRAVVMSSQVDVLNGKQKALRRYRDGLATLVDELRSFAEIQALPLLAPPIAAPGAEGGESDLDTGGGGANLGGAVPPDVARLIQSAQEDLRRDISRAMHDGPAQSLTNIVLQAQIVDRLIGRDPALLRPEVSQLVTMVQSTLDATKSFIFDVRPMVLDDLGLVPTLRRSSRDRGRRANIPVEFDSLGADRRLPMELESGLFRILEEAVAAFLAVGPDRVVLRLDWSESLEAMVRSVRDGAPAGRSAPDEPAVGAPVTEEPSEGAGGRPSGRGRGRGAARPEPEMPAALAAMIADRRGEEAAALAATIAPLAMPAKAWREIQSRAVTLRATVSLSPTGDELRIVVDLPPAA